MNVLTTGVAGFIGSYLARQLLEDGHKVYGVDDFSVGRSENVPKGVELIVHDLSDPDVTRRLPANVEVIMHLAGQSSGEISFDDPVMDLNMNVASTLNLIRYSIQCGARRIVYASSMSVYGPTPDRPIDEDTACAPLSCYGVGKLAAENYLKVFADRLPFTAFRIFNVYGPGQDLANAKQGMVSIFVAQAVETGSILVRGRLDRFRDFVYVDDVVDIWIKSIDTRSAENRIINLGTGTRTTVIELLDLIKERIPGIGISELASTPGDQLGIYADTTRLCDVFGLKALTPLKHGLSRFIDWVEQQQLD